MSNYTEATAMAGYDLAHASAVRNVIEALPRETHLHYVGYRDTLLDDLQVAQAWLEDDREVVYEKVDEWYQEGEWLAEDEYLTSACRDAGVELDELTAGDEEGIREVIRERNASDPIADLVRNTGSALFRATLVEPYVVDDTEYREVIWYGDLEEAKMTRAGGRFRFTGHREGQAYYLARDGYYGSGGDYPIPRDAVVEIEPDTTRLDEAPGDGYSWTEIAGPAPLAYAANITKED